MLARAAQNLYWMARYLERAENTARLINSTTDVLLDLPHGASLGWDTLISAVGLDELYGKQYTQANEDSIMRFMIEDEDNPSSIMSCVKYARENTRTLRELLPEDLWECINSLYLYLRDHANLATTSRRERYLVLNNVIAKRHAIVGLISGVMAHDMAYQFIRLGRNIERADMTTRILDINFAVSIPEDMALYEMSVERLWMSTLKALSAYQTYRRLKAVHVSSKNVIEFLINDESFPRSLLYCLNEMESCLRVVPFSETVLNTVRNSRMNLLRLLSGNLQSDELHVLLDLTQKDLGEINSALNKQYFHAKVDQNQNSSGAETLQE
jgi:uncharacterized alpha-E superfamily protein